jgi:hypothetical protein
LLTRTRACAQAEFPFHVAARKAVAEAALRRPRFLDASTNTWNIIRPFQTWTLGEARARSVLKVRAHAAYLDDGCKPLCCSAAHAAMLRCIGGRPRQMSKLDASLHLADHQSSSARVPK